MAVEGMGFNEGKAGRRTVGDAKRKGRLVVK